MGNLALQPDSTELLTTLGEGVRSEAAGTRKGTKRVAQILSAALESLAESGYQGLTLEGIAQRVGISKGNLQYYFPTRSNLLQATFAEQIERHKKHWSSVINQPAANGVERLRRLIAFELDANRDREFVALVLERWALAERDDALRRLTKNWHSWVTRRYAQLIAEIRPDLDKRAHRHLGMIAYSMLVGLAPYRGRDDDDSQFAKGLETRIAETILDLIKVAK